jgi:hypothetical protein
MVVIAGRHAVGGQLGGQIVKEPGQLDPVCPRAPQLRGNPRYDDVCVAQRLVKGNGIDQCVVLYEVERGMPPAADQAKLVQQRLEFLGAVFWRAGKLDA